MTPKVYTGKSMCEMGTCDCPTNPDCVCCKKSSGIAPDWKDSVYKPKNWEKRWIDQLRRKEEDEPEFVTKRKQEMIRLIEAGRGGEIDYDEWGEVYYPVDPDHT